MLRLLLLGSPALLRDETAIRLETRKAMALLAYLAVTRHGQPRQSLAAMLWPDLEPSRALANLRRTLWSLNKSLGSDRIIADGDVVELRLDGELWVDVARFEDLAIQAANPTALEEASSLYRGDFMSGIDLDESAGLAEWIFFQAENYKRIYDKVLRQLAEWWAGQGSYDKAINFARRWLALDGLNEDAHRALMRLYATTGQRPAALRQYRECARILGDELGAEPSEETRALLRAIQNGGLDAPRVPAAAAAITAPVAPQLAEHFVGRETEMERIRAALTSPDCRWLTLTGPGGIGKSRLAVEAAQGLDGAFPDGVWLASLASLTSPRYVLEALAQALGLASSGSDDVRARLLGYAADKRALVVLDNFEHLVDAAGDLSDLLAAAPRVKLLVTSRERLNVRSEWTLAVEGLRAEDAAGLFRHHARRANPGSVFGPEDDPAIARIVEGVSGMPLGIELAANWARVMTCGEIAHEIEHGIDFLRTSQRDLPERHRSLRAVFDRSLEMLSEAERHTLLRMSVFRGGWTRQAGEAVADASLDVLSSLVDKSLVSRRDTATGPRYDMLIPLRQYAGGLLLLDPQAWDETRDRHCAYFARFLAAHEHDLESRRQIAALAEIEADAENVWSMWLWAADRGRFDDLARAAWAASSFCELRGRFHEGRDAFALAAKAAVAAGKTLLQAEMLLYGGLLVRLNETDTAHQWIEQAHALLMDIREQPGARQLMAMSQLLRPHASITEERAAAEESAHIFHSMGDAFGEAMALLSLGNACFAAGDADTAREWYRRSLAMADQAGNRRGQFAALDALGELEQMSGDYAAAKQHYERNLAILTELGYQWGIALARDRIGYVARQIGDYAEAVRWHEESLAEHRALNDVLGIGGSLCNLGLVAFDQGQYGRAKALFEESLVPRRAANDDWARGMSLTYLAHAEQALGQPEAAERALAEVDRLAHLPGSDWLIAQAAAIRARIALARGDVNLAADHIRHALAHTGGIRTIDVLEAVRLVEARVLQAQGLRSEARSVAAGILERRVASAAVLAEASALHAALAE